MEDSRTVVRAPKCFRIAGVNDKMVKAMSDHENYNVSLDSFDRMVDFIWLSSYRWTKLSAEIDHVQKGLDNIFAFKLCFSSVPYMKTFSRKSIENAPRGRSFSKLKRAGIERILAWNLLH